MIESTQNDNDGERPIEREINSIVNNLHPMTKAFLAGCFSGTCSTLLLQPFDLLKTRLQTSSAAYASTPSTINPRVSLRRVCLQVIRDEKVTALWRGTVPSLIRCVPGVGIYFCCIHTLQTHFCVGRTPNPLEAAAFGLTARCVAGAMLLPATVIKTRLESGLFAYTGVSHALRCIYRTEGLRGLFSGLSATLLRDAPFSALHLAIYTQLRHRFAANKIESSGAGSSAHSSHSIRLWSNAADAFLCSLVAALGASLLTQPADVIKTRMQTATKSRVGPLQTARQLYQVYGPAEFWRGLTPRLARRALMSALAWTVFETLISAAGLNEMDQLMSDLWS